MFGEFRERQPGIYHQRFEIKRGRFFVFGEQIFGRRPQNSLDILAGAFVTAVNDNPLAVEMANIDPPKINYPQKAVVMKVYKVADHQADFVHMGRNQDSRARFLPRMQRPSPLFGRNQVAEAVRVYPVDQRLPYFFDDRGDICFKSGGAGGFG